MLSRNFRLQRVGDLLWLQKNYNFAHIAFYIDELVVLDVTRGQRDPEAFCSTLKALTAGCFVPIAAGGGLRSVEYARQLLRSGADKVVVNSPLFDQPNLVKELAGEFGQQCVVASVDMKCDQDGSYRAYSLSGTKRIEASLSEMEWLRESHAGELYINSIDKDGTGQGYDLELLDQIPTDCALPIILAGGVGNGTHLAAGLDDKRVDAVATAHLFNFVGDGLQRARVNLVKQGASLATWPELAEFDLGPSVRTEIV